MLQNQRDGDWNPGRQAIYGSDPNIPRFTLGPTCDAYWQLKQNLPWLLLPAKEQEWLDEFDEHRPGPSPGTVTVE